MGRRIQTAQAAGKMLSLRSASGQIHKRRSLTGGSFGGGFGQLPRGKGFGGGCVAKLALQVASRVQTACPHDWDCVGLNTLAIVALGFGAQFPAGQFGAVPRR